MRAAAKGRVRGAAAGRNAHLGKPEMETTPAVFHYIFNLTSTSPRPTLHRKARMFSPALPRRMLQCTRQTRLFSSSPMASAAEIKRLGVVGAGQMVRTASCNLISLC